MGLLSFSADPIYTKNGINLYIFIVAFIKNFLSVVKHIDLST